MVGTVTAVRPKAACLLPTPDGAGVDADVGLLLQSAGSRTKAAQSDGRVRHRVLFPLWAGMR